MVDEILRNPVALILSIEQSITVFIYNLSKPVWYASLRHKLYTQKRYEKKIPFQMKNATRELIYVKAGVL